MYKLESLLEQANELPPLPEIYIKLSELLESETTRAGEIGEVIQTDPSLTATILKMINSAYYGMPNEVSSISRAISLLGRQQIKQIIMGSVLAGVFKNVDVAGFPMHEFWLHSVKTAIIARHLAMQNVNVIDHEAFFTAGLLHDIGRLVIAQVAPDALVEVESRVRSEGIDIVQAEIDVLGVTHIDVGEALMKKWGMPNMLTQCLLKHHETEHVGPFAIDTSVVYLANKLSQQPLAANEEEMQKLLLLIPNWEITQCTLEQINIACQLADEQWYEIMQSLGMAESNDTDELIY